ncbi:helix-turn-helix domain-containing protein [Aetokthonos hydrillicola Thurmond2011]|jgi:transcriptional regulator with XRE-family HTH domain|uniref:Helix-turn-helix domain-containing protein n=1 Tax=Aetokthonos hydrillicola Thurmond2011 TaxID=2712845 RepID=A0AAP5M7J5_9CYAN|nr:helix-turn-helix transcriptional regulator [Aetokthonos hydrillicola]MBO3460034.1 helix-turn-helix transcriptional regulator [Aetokthonos hydrillicola CCALA 1050]MBW4584631.1 helix-turn-helix domain-containing protein [Aetokthonos hydrillicola CCALA 1050]MDR9895175.1 helix-turn-helix domain-containing protein [Aetokthonos hydrillicola Thurmond2011]
MLSSQCRKRLSQLCLRCRGKTPLRKFAPRVGVSSSAWNAWENESGNWGIDNARKLATFLGTSVDKLQQYINGEYSLDDYLRLPHLNTGELEMPDSDDTVDQVIVWMGSLSLRDLLRLISAGVRLAEITVDPNSKAGNEKHNQPEPLVASKPAADGKIEFESKDGKLALKCWYDVSQGKIPSNPELIKLAAALDIDTSSLKKTITKLSEIMANEANN